MEWCSKNRKPNGDFYNLYTDGLVVHTTIDSKIQDIFENAVKKKMKELVRKNFTNIGKDIQTPLTQGTQRKDIDRIINDGIKRSVRYKKLINKGKSKEQINKIFNRKVNTTLFSWNGEIDTLISPRDSVIYNKFFIHTGVMSMNPTDGHVKAMLEE